MERYLQGKCSGIISVKIYHIYSGCFTPLSAHWSHSVCRAEQGQRAPPVSCAFHGGAGRVHLREDLQGSPVPARHGPGSAGGHKDLKGRLQPPAVERLPAGAGLISPPPPQSFEFTPSSSLHENTWQCFVCVATVRAHTHRRTTCSLLRARRGKKDLWAGSVCCFS